MVTKGRGFTVEDINGSCPADLRPYAKAHKMEIQEQDLLNYIAVGQYYRSALHEIIASVFSALSGKKDPGIEFVSKPVLYEDADKSKDLTEEDKQRILERHVLMRKIEKFNFDMYKKRRGT